ncbi:MAG TPA: hypothetical protein VE866_06055 [Candidatus Binatia bacterium]|nr:hypothetical protein [Candidatus Binatia bacterium]
MSTPTMATSFTIRVRGIVDEDSEKPYEEMRRPHADVQVCAFSEYTAWREFDMDFNDHMKQIKWKMPDGSDVPAGLNVSYHYHTNLDAETGEEVEWRP